MCGLTAAAHVEGQPVTRGLFLLYGTSLLVAPVLEAGARSQRVLPAGALGLRWLGGERSDGGAWVEVDAPLDVIPVFARDEELAEPVGKLQG
ncbi:hypothetical protein [Sanguibacter biliveldensis]|uniref:hypothetical protein n=1 Tax=Sanguibacter biliveldensis TaxID=3030830 RepID=UPI0038CD8ECF